jgi:hypothetical protein
LSHQAGDDKEYGEILTHVSKTLVERDSLTRLYMRGTYMHRT